MLPRMLGAVNVSSSRVAAGSLTTRVTGRGEAEGKKIEITNEKITEKKKKETRAADEESEFKGYPMVP